MALNYWDAEEFLQAEKYAAEVRRVYEQAETTLIKTVADIVRTGVNKDDLDWAASRLGEVHELNKQIQTQVESLKKLDPDVQAAIETSYTEGSKAAAEQLRASNLADMSADIRYSAGSGVRAIVEQTIGKLDGTHMRILRSTMDGYRNVIAQASEQALAGSMGRRQAAQLALNKFAEQGISGFVDSAGRNWDLASYAETATRTAVIRAGSQGHLDKLEANEQDLVIVSSHPESCDVCDPWEGQILSISGTSTEYPSVDEAIADGLQHPNCSHIFDLWLEGFSTPMTTDISKEENDQAYKKREQQRYNERQIRYWKRQEAAAITPYASSRASAKIGEWGQRQKDFIAETGRRRDYDRESITKAR